MGEKTPIRERFFPQSLRFRVAVGVALPLLILMIILSLIHYFRARELLENQILISASQMGQAALGSLRHTMMEQDLSHLRESIQDLGGIENINQVVLIDQNGKAAAGDDRAVIGTIFQTTDPGCIECHRISPDQREQATILENSAGTLRIAAPVDNGPECRACHSETSGHLGVLLIDMSLAQGQAQLVKDLQIDLAVSAAFTLLITIVLYQLINRLVVRRIEQFKQPLQAMSAGNFDVNLPSSERPHDEIDILANTINSLSAELRHQREQEETRQRTRHNAIVEERERIAREMHDGIAQLMGYVSNKTSAIRLLLEKDASREAIEQLEELAGASHDSFIEVRAAILGLRTSDQNGEGLVATLERFVTKFSDMSGINVELNLPPSDHTISINPESELHILRITQESLSNIQKYANTHDARVGLHVFDRTLELTISDNGRGFDLDQAPKDSRPRFGLSTMRERAEAMHASFEVDSKPGSGTRILVRIPMEAG